MKKERNSNLELFRIISMLLIIAHHYVVNGGDLLSPDGPILSNPFSVHSLFLLVFGAFGKTGINCFVLITGYFMCKQDITVTKYAKLVLEIIFYKICVGLIFVLAGYSNVSVMTFIKRCLPVSSIGSNFTGCFVVFFLFIPFLNIFIRGMNEKQHKWLMLLCVFTYILMDLFKAVVINYVSWFMVLYIIASYIRLYPKDIFSKTKFWGMAFVTSMVMSVISIIVFTRLSGTYDNLYHYYLLQDSNALLAVTNGLSGFLFFKNLSIRPSKVINKFGASTFGVLLIHANGPEMRQFLWGTLLNNHEAYYHRWGYIHAILSVIMIFIICSCIDMLRIKFIEKPFFERFSEKFDMINRRLSNSNNVNM